MDRTPDSVRNNTVLRGHLPIKKRDNYGEKRKIDRHVVSHSNGRYGYVYEQTTKKKRDLYRRGGFSPVDFVIIILKVLHLDSRHLRYRANVTSVKHSRMQNYIRMEFYELLNLRKLIYIYIRARMRRTLNLNPWGL